MSTVITAEGVSKTYRLGMIGGATLKELGAVFADDLGPWKAQILLTLALPQTKDPAQLQAYFDK